MAGSALERLRESNQRARAKTTALEQNIVRKALISGTGAALGYASKKGVREELGGVPVKLGLAALGALGELLLKGAAQRAAGAVGDASLAIYSHEAMQEGTFVAGTTGGNL